MNGTFCATDADCAPLQQSLRASDVTRQASKSVALDLRTVGRGPKSPPSNALGLNGKDAKARVAAAAASGRHPNCKNMGTHYYPDKTVVRGGTVGTSCPTKRYPSYMMREAGKGKSVSYSVKLESVVMGGISAARSSATERRPSSAPQVSGGNRAARTAPIEYGWCTTGEARIKSGKPVF